MARTGRDRSPFHISEEEFQRRLSTQRLADFQRGLGGRELTPEMMDEMADLTRRAGEGEDVPVVSWIGVRE